MCCILCEEPFRSLTIGLAAVGLVTIVRMAQKSLRSWRRNASAETQHHPLTDAAVPVRAAITDEVS